MCTWAALQDIAQNTRNEQRRNNYGGSRTTDKALLARVADVLSHREDTSPSKGERETRLITQAEAAKRLGVSTTTVWRLIKEGSLSVISVRGKQRVRLASLTQYALGEADHV